MAKRQNVIVLLLLFLVVSLTVRAQHNDGLPAEVRLQRADSLYKQQKYTQSLDLYATLLKRDNVASPSMLLKMAFIQEGLGNYTEALYYLNLYYQMTYDRRALKKMEMLAETHHLAGYDYDDTQFFLNLYHRYRLQINIGIMAIALLLAVLLVRNSLKQKKRPVASGTALVLFLLALLWLNNFGREKPKALVTQDAVYVMSGPSAGANVLEVIDKGHRVIVRDRIDVWTKIEWRERHAYVKSDQLANLDL